MVQHELQCSASHCPSQEHAFSSQGNLNRHMRIIHQVPYTPSERIRKVFTCLFSGCKRTFITEQDLERHRNVHMGVWQCKETDCSWSNRASRGESKYVIHMRASHGISLPPTPREVFGCKFPDCGRYLTTKSILKRHLELHDTQEMPEPQLIPQQIPQLDYQGSQSSQQYTNIDEIQVTAGHQTNSHLLYQDDQDPCQWVAATNIEVVNMMAELPPIRQLHDQGSQLPQQSVNMASVKFTAGHPANSHLFYQDDQGPCQLIAAPNTEVVEMVAELPANSSYTNEMGLTQVGENMALDSAVPQNLFNLRNMNSTLSSDTVLAFQDQVQVQEEVEPGHARTEQCPRPSTRNSMDTSDYMRCLGKASLDHGGDSMSQSPTTFTLRKYQQPHAAPRREGPGTNGREQSPDPDDISELFLGTSNCTPWLGETSLDKNLILILQPPFMNVSSLDETGVAQMDESVVPSLILPQTLLTDVNNYTPYPDESMAQNLAIPEGLSMGASNSALQLEGTPDLIMPSTLLTDLNNYTPYLDEMGPAIRHALSISTSSYDSDEMCLTQVNESVTQSLAIPQGLSIGAGNSTPQHIPLSHRTRTSEPNNASDTLHGQLPVHPSA
ncbi:hypothetical protein EDB81DRAFT_763848 [Dactylonectria macrodidyma]|uniref:C2H2-type domain-containing protein n=1 Tax=Dactylonectria macrodidyma TaxID=307937 RepID=A0A9P9IU54_9HYPO|nr:hypothetical protein EDB81DRAFT_763848 [Dactylonectria macrodidyma]